MEISVVHAGSEAVAGPLAGREGVPEVRGWARGVLRGWGVRGEAIDSGALVLSELVTNAVVHGVGPVTVRLSLRGEGGFVVEVRDKGDHALVLRAPGELAECGRGLLITDALASEWGVNPVAGGGKCVWAAVGG
ncbi:ATP-binding protein [Actinomadura parmotrematis]|uniref:ATP-binding protein n=1 Tax=Actinomadura parmotrematis TaxID=2864039 RepID=A0ABS7FZP7_9ACTN|nr:ATP-binding protein [Actinomadura parmotrematis]MBW8485776.1 ATP-binding protein [Actinomadura parmotrematis]